MDVLRAALTDEVAAGGMAVMTSMEMALAARDYVGAASHFAKSDRPLLVYALCLAGEMDAARRFARVVEPGDADELRFWRWLRSTFGVSPPNL